jgi:hypothetical protein
VSRVDRDQTRDPCCQPAHASGGRNARTVRERVPKEMQSDSEAAAENCNINRIGCPWRVRMFHRSWFQVTLVLTCMSDPGRQDSASSRAPPASMSESNREHECVRRHGVFSSAVGKLGIASMSGDESTMGETAPRGRSLGVGGNREDPRRHRIRHGHELRAYLVLLIARAALAAAPPRSGGEEMSTSTTTPARVRHSQTRRRAAGCLAPRIAWMTPNGSRG